MEMSLRFKDNVAVITGAGDGIGKAIAYRLAKEGATVVLLDRNGNMLERTLSEFSKEQLSAEAHLVDISDEDQVRHAISNVRDKWRRIDVMVHAAGIVGPTNTKIVDYPTADFDMICSVNLKGTFLITKYTLQVMKEHGAGRVLLIASIAGKEGNPGMIGYSATKAAVIGIVKGAAKEYATEGITVNGLAPAVIKTAMNRDTTPEQLSYMTAKIPMQRLGTVEEVAAMSCFIVSPENSFCTGFVFDISGGRATY